MSDLSYPIGKLDVRPDLNEQDRRELITAIREAPAKLRAAVEGLTEEQLETPYRPAGWSVRQVVHHMVDSHVNAYVRFRWALTEDNPTIKAYEQAEWAELPDARSAPIEASLDTLEALHRRWLFLLEAMGPSDFARSWVHPEDPEGAYDVDVLLQIYGWHSLHHVAHITSLRERMAW